MSDNVLLEHIGKMMLDNNEKLLASVEKKILASEERTVVAIKSSQEDTIEVLTDVINTGYNLHEERIQRLEDKVGLPPLRQKQ